MLAIQIYWTVHRTIGLRETPLAVFSGFSMEGHLVVGRLSRRQSPQAKLMGMPSR